MAEAAGRRRCLQEKEAFQNLVVSVPCFISQQPSKHVAVSKEQPAFTHSSYQDRLYYNSSRFVSTRLYSFPTAQQAETFLNAYLEAVVKPSQGREWAEYCYSDETFEDLLYHPGYVFVPWPQTQLRDLLGEVSQLVVCHGLPMEQHLRRSSPLLHFLDHRILSLEHIYYRWRVYAYLQGDGEKRYRSESFSIVHSGQQWFPPVQPTLQRALLNNRQRKHFAQLLTKISRRKHEVEEAMVFAISRADCGVEVSAMIALEILHRTTGDSLPLFYLISDILFNATTPDYRRLFAYLLPLLLQRLATNVNTKFRSQLRALIHHWELKFIFEDNYTQGLLFLLAEGNNAAARGVHDKLRTIGHIEDEEESEFQLEKLCLANGIPLLSGNREESMRLINEYLWRQEAEQQPPQLNESYDGEPLTEKDLMRIKNKQVKVVTSESLNVAMLLEKNWQTKARAGQGGSVDYEAN